MGAESRRIRQLMNIGFPTGSFYLGCDNPKDQDWVVRSSDWSKIVGHDLGGFFYKGGEYSECSFRSFFVEEKGPPFNFIVLSDDEEFQTWKIATRLMKRIPLRFIQSKSHRVRLFETLKTIIFERNAVGLTYNKNDEIDDDVPF